MIKYGDGFPLFFQFLKYVVLLFVLVFILQGLYFFVVLIVFYFADSKLKEVSISKVLSADIIVDKEGNVIEPIVIAYEVIAMLVNFLLIIVTCIFWVRQIRYKNQLDDENKTDADYAVMFQLLPKEITKNELHELVAKAGVDDNNIVYTNRCFEFNHILKLKKKQ